MINQSIFFLHIVLSRSKLSNSLHHQIDRSFQITANCNSHILNEVYIAQIAPSFLIQLSVTCRLSFSQVVRKNKNCDSFIPSCLDVFLTGCGSPGSRWWWWASGNASPYEIPSTSHGEMEKDKVTLQLICSLRLKD